MVLKSGNSNLFRSSLTIACLELQKSIYSPVFAIYSAGFLIMLSTSIFITGGFLDSNLLSLRAQWNSLPFISVLFVCLFAMRMFDSKTNSSELNLILSKPLSTGVVLGKWLCGLLF